MIKSREQKHYHAPSGGVRIKGRNYEEGSRIPAKYGRMVNGTGEPVARDPSIDSEHVPPGFGKPILPHITSFQGLISTVSHVYRNPDEAIKHSVENARFMRNDTTIMECLEARQRMTALLNWHIEPEDCADEQQKKLADDMTRIMQKIPRFTEYRRNLLDALWYGRHAVQHMYGFKWIEGEKRVVVKHWEPVNGDKLVFRFDDGRAKFDPNEVGIKVSTVWPSRDVVLGNRKIEITEYGPCYFLEPWERSRLAVHKHIIEDGTYEDPVSSGRVHGVGIRDRIYWTWFQKQETMAHLMEIIERTGNGFTIYYYPAGNNKAKSDVEALAREQTHTNTILMPRMPGDPAMDAYGIDRIEPSTAGVEALRSIVVEFFGHQIKRYILGQTLSSEQGGGGFGDGVASLHLETLLQIVQYDAIGLEETLTKESLEPLKNFNFPWARDIELRFVIDTESADADKKMSAYRAAWDLGVKLKASDVMDIIGASVPTEDDETLQNPTMMQQTRLWDQKHDTAFGSDPGDPDAMGPDGMPPGGPEDTGGPDMGGGEPGLGEPIDGEPGAGEPGDSEDDMEAMFGPLMDSIGGKGEEEGADQYARKQPRSSPGQTSLFGGAPTGKRADWKEELHPRDHGKFSSKEGEKASGDDDRPLLDDVDTDEFHGSLQQAIDENEPAEDHEHEDDALPPDETGDVHERHAEALNEAKEFSDYGQDYDRNIASSYHRYLNAAERGHNDEMLDHLHGELEARLDAKRERVGKPEADEAKADELTGDGRKVTNVRGGRGRFKDAQSIGDIRAKLRKDESIHIATYGSDRRQQIEVRRADTHGGAWGGRAGRGIVATAKFHAEAPSEPPQGDEGDTADKLSNEYRGVPIETNDDPRAVGANYDPTRGVISLSQRVQGLPANERERYIEHEYRHHEWEGLSDDQRQLWHDVGTESSVSEFMWNEYGQRPGKLMGGEVRAFGLSPHGDIDDDSVPDAIAVAKDAEDDLTSAPPEPPTGDADKNSIFTQGSIRELRKKIEDNEAAGWADSDEWKADMLQGQKDDLKQMLSMTKDKQGDADEPQVKAEETQAEAGLSREHELDLSKRIDRNESQAGKYEGGHGLPVGAEGVDFRWKADALRHMRDRLNKGDSVEEAAASAKKKAREWIERHNARRPKDINWKRWDGAADSEIEHASRSLNRSATPPEPPQGDADEPQYPITGDQHPGLDADTHADVAGRRHDEIQRLQDMKTKAEGMSNDELREANLAPHLKGIAPSHHKAKLLRHIDSEIERETKARDMQVEYANKAGHEGNFSWMGDAGEPQAAEATSETAEHPLQAKRDKLRELFGGDLDDKLIDSLGEKALDASIEARAAKVKEPTKPKPAGAEPRAEVSSEVPADTLKEMASIQKGIEKSTAKLDKMNESHMKRLKTQGRSRGRSTTHAANAGNEASRRDGLKSSLSRMVREELRAGRTVPQSIADAVGAGVEYDEKGNYDPITPDTKTTAEAVEGAEPKQGDDTQRVTNDDFADGDWDMAHAGLASEAVQAKIADGMKGIEGREYAIREHSEGKWQLISKKPGEPQAAGAGTQEKAKTKPKAAELHPLAKAAGVKSAKDAKKKGIETLIDNVDSARDAAGESLKEIATRLYSPQFAKGLVDKAIQFTIEATTIHGNAEMGFDTAMSRLGNMSQTRDGDPLDQNVRDMFALAAKTLTASKSQIIAAMRGKSDEVTTEAEPDEPESSQPSMASMMGEGDVPKVKSTAPGVKHDQVPFAAAMDAHRNSSFVPERRAVQRQNEYVSQMNADWEHVSGFAETPEQQELAESEFERYRSKYLDHTLGVLGAASRTASSMITGPANFPTASNRRKLDAETKKSDGRAEFRKRAMRAIVKKIRPDIGLIKSSDSSAVEHLQKKLDGLAKFHETAKAANKVIRQHVSKSDQDGTVTYKDGKTREDTVKALAELGMSEKTASDTLKPDYMGRVGVPSYSLTNNSANMRRIKSRIKEVSAMQAAPASESQYSGDVTVAEDPDSARIRIHFPGKPEKEHIKELKSHGFRWSPKADAWQRHLNNAGRYAVENVLSKIGHEKIESENVHTDTDDIPDMLPASKDTDK